MTSKCYTSTTNFISYELAVILELGWLMRAYSSSSLTSHLIMKCRVVCGTVELKLAERSIVSSAHDAHQRVRGAGVPASATTRIADEVAMSAGDELDAPATLLSKFNLRHAIENICGMIDILGIHKLPDLEIAFRSLQSDVIVVQKAQISSLKPV